VCAQTIVPFGHDNAGQSTIVSVGGFSMKLPERYVGGRYVGGAAAGSKLCVWVELLAAFSLSRG
jgi:hypothetical protein